MIERLVIVTILAVLGIVLYQLYTRRQLAQISAYRHIDPILNGLNTNVPTIVYFTTPNCIPCKTQQQPAINKVRETQEVQVVQIDATQNPEAADRWGVMSAPTTFILDSNFNPKSVNHGVADEAKLIKQMNDAMQIA
ncbi:MAG: thioredoxin family protein [Phototrophicaceae bacterium]